MPTSVTAQTRVVTIPSFVALTLTAFAAHAQAVAIPSAWPGAASYMSVRNEYWAAAQMLALAIPAVFVFTGVGAKLRAFCARICGGRWLGTVTLFAIIYVIANAVLLAPFDFYRGYASVQGLPDAPSFSQWTRSEAVAAGARIVAAALFVWIPYAIIRRSPTRWWLYAAAALIPVAFFILVVLPVAVDPLTATYRPLAGGKLSAQIAELAARCGVRDIPVYVGGDDDTVVGLGPTKRVVLDENIFKRETPDQIRFTVGHELKHYVENDNYKAVAIIAVLLLTGFWLTDRIGRWVMARFGHRTGFRELSDPASLPLIVLILTVYWLCVLPFFNLYARHIEQEADRFGLELTHENRADAELEASYIVRDRETPEWSTFFLIFRATHPSDADRIRFANSYRPWNEGRPLVYGKVCREKPHARTGALRPQVRH